MNPGPWPLLFPQVAASSPSAVRGLVLLNSAGAMNNKGVLEDWRIVMALPLLLLVRARCPFFPPPPPHTHMGMPLH